MRSEGRSRSTKGRGVGEGFHRSHTSAFIAYLEGILIGISGGETRCSAVRLAHLFWVQSAFPSFVGKERSTLGSNPVTLMRNLVNPNNAKLSQPKYEHQSAVITSSYYSQAAVYSDVFNLP